MRSLQKENDKTYLNFYFQVHQPRRIRRFGFFDIGKGIPVFDDELNREIILRVAKTCYLPSNEMFLELIRKYPRMRLTFSISGTALEQFQKYAPEVIDSFRRLASTGAVEFLAETYYHSLSCVSNHEDFRRQVQQHRQAIAEHFGVVPKVFRNTELIYSDEVGRLIREMGFDGIYADGIGKILRYRSPDHLYEHAQGNGLKLFLRNFRLSDDIAFRFSDRKWKEWPLTAEKFTQWLLAGHSPQRLINLGLDYETFGEHHKYDTGIFQFMKHVVAAVSKSKKIGMVTPSEAITLLEAKDRLSSPSYISWADRERDLSAWLGNDLQKDAFDTLKTLGKKIAETGDGSLKSAWNYLQTSDHFYYMSTKKGDDGKVHNYFSPYPSPYEAFIAYMNVITELSLRLKHMKKAILKPETRVPVGTHKPLMVA